MGIAAQEKRDQECIDNVGSGPSWHGGSCRLLLVLEDFVETSEQVKKWLCLVKKATTANPPSKLAPGRHFGLR